MASIASLPAVETSNTITAWSESMWLCYFQLGPDIRILNMLCNVSNPPALATSAYAARISDTFWIGISCWDLDDGCAEFVWILLSVLVS